MTIIYNDYITLDSVGNYENQVHWCKYCGKYHCSTCPRIESIEYYPNGTVKKIVFKQDYEYEKI